jgi:multiple sugar transport system substrate-binding protein
MNRKRAVLIALTAASAVGLTTACGSSGGGSGSANGADFSANAKGTMTAWAFDNPDDVGQARLDDAKAALSGVTIKMDETAFDAQKFTTRVAGGNVPDVVQMDRAFVATYAAQGLIMPLDKCYSAHKVDPKQRFYQAMVDDVTYKDQVWAAPQFLQPNLIILNERVMKAAGVTNDQIDTSKPDVLLAAIKKMYKSSGGNPSVLGLDPVPTGQDYQWVIGLAGSWPTRTASPPWTTRTTSTRSSS